MQIQAFDSIFGDTFDDSLRIPDHTDVQELNGATLDAIKQWMSPDNNNADVSDIQASVALIPMIESDRSTVRRHATQQKFLQECGNLIMLLKLSGYMFFGTIVRVEDTIKQLMDDAQFKEAPFRYLILDMTAVSNIDFSAAEAFIRIKKLLDSKNVYLVMSGIGTNSPISSALGAVGLWKGSCTQGTDVRLFSNLNEALEWCENEFLSLYYSARDVAN